MSEHQDDLLALDIKYIREALDKIEKHLETMNNRVNKHGKMIAVHSALIGLIGILFSILATKITFSF